VTIVTEVRSESFGLVTERRHYNCHHREVQRATSQRSTATIVECGIARFLCATCAYSTFWHQPQPYTLPLCQLSFLLCPPLVS